MRGGWWILVGVMAACSDTAKDVTSDTGLPEVQDTSNPPEVDAELEDTSAPEDLSATSCNINGTSVPAGSADPANACRLCDLTMPNIWSNAVDGASCEAGRCLGGRCIAAPRVDGATPSCAANRGGDLVTLSGAHFAEGATATIAGLPAALTWRSDRELTLTVPAAPDRLGAVPLTVVNPDGQSGSSAAPFLLFGGLAFEPAHKLTFDSVPRRFAAGDVDGDGRDDLVLPLTGAIHVARQGQSSGHFDVITALTGCDPYTIAVLEATGDTLADIVAACADGLKVYAGTAAGLPTLVENTPIAMAPADQIVAGLFDDDGVLDLAISYHTSNEIKIFRGQPGGAFTASATLSLTAKAAWLDAGDLSGDGLDDLVVAHTDANRVELFLATQSFTFAAPKSLTVARPGTVQLARIDGDALKDLVISSQDSEVSASWFRSLGDGTFAERVNFTFGGLIGAAVGDFDKDGLGDAIVNSGEGIRMFPSDVDGTVGCSLSLPIEPAPQYLLVGDFDGNGHLDIAGRNASHTEAYLLMQKTP